MTNYSLNFNSRMVAIACGCVALLGILLFLLGVEIGKLWVRSDQAIKVTTNETNVSAAKREYSPEVSANAQNTR